MVNKCHGIKHIGQSILLLVFVSLLWNCERPDAVISKEIPNYNRASNGSAIIYYARSLSDTG